MKKKVLGYIKLQIPAGKANPSPPVGPALGQKGLNIMEFCKAFNEATSKMDQGVPTPVVITAYADKSFTFITKTPPVSYFVKKYANVQKGSSTTGKDYAGSIKQSDIMEIAKIKIQDMNTESLDSAASMIAGSAVSMGIKVVEG